MDFEIVSREDCAVVGDREEMFSKLEQDLISQVKMCMTNRKYFQEVGDIASGNKFEQMALHAKKDLDAVRSGQNICRKCSKKTFWADDSLTK